jgi:outer membrane lipoprotein-sorting protein
MTATRWDRAGSLPVPVRGRPRPELASLPPADLPSVAQLFTFMRDAELRFETLRMRVEERTATTQGDQTFATDIWLRHPGWARMLTSDADAGLKGEYEVWLSDGETVRTYVAARKVGTERPVRARVRGVTDDRDLPGRSRVYTPMTSLQMESLPDLFIHPAGYCQNVLGTGDTRILGASLLRDRETILVQCRHPRVVETVADRPDFTIDLAVDRLDGVILRLQETLGGRVTRVAEATVYQPDAPLPPNIFEFTFPSDATILY